MHELTTELLDLKEEHFGSSEYKKQLKEIDDHYRHLQNMDEGFGVDYYEIAYASNTYKHFKTKQEARKYLTECWDKNPDNSYYCTYDFKRSSKYVSLRQRLKTEEKKLEDYSKKHSASSFKAKLIGCDYCGSKIAKTWIKNGNECPVCGNDLRSKTTIETIKRYRQNISDLNKQIRDEEKNMQNKKNSKLTTKGTLVLVAIDSHV